MDHWGPEGLSQAGSEKAQGEEDLERSAKRASVFTALSRNCFLLFKTFPWWMMKSSPLAHHPPTATSTQWFSTWGNFCSQGTFLVVIFEVGVGGGMETHWYPAGRGKDVAKDFTLHKWDSQERVTRPQMSTAPRLRHPEAEAVENQPWIGASFFSVEADCCYFALSSTHSESDNSFWPGLRIPTQSPQNSGGAD